MNITVRESIRIDAPPEVVWDYTQDWTRRTEWDPGIVAAELLPGEPRSVRVRGRGGLKLLVQYKLQDRPKRTSLVMMDAVGAAVRGGGSWEYAADGDATIFTQTNTLVVRNRVVAWLIGWLLRRALASSTRAANANAKARIEAGSR